MNSIRAISLESARQLAITRQRLAGPRPRADANGIMEIARDLRCLQIDPTSAVARNHLLVLWSRLGAYERAELDKLLWKERALFEYWAHAASIVLTEDYAIHNLMMRRYPGGDKRGDTNWSQRVREWMAKNEPLRKKILGALRRQGPLLSRQLEEMGIPSVEWVSTGWTGGRNVSRMLDFLWAQGKIMVAGRAGGQKLWDLSERVLPEWTPREKLSEREVVHRAAQKSLRALGVATEQQIKQHFIRWRYPGLKDILMEFERDGLIERVELREDGRAFPGTWYIHREDVPLLEQLERDEFEPRTTLLSPFDNLICDRARTRQLFDFDYTIEIYTPKHKRKYGYFVMPILQGDKLIGRVDPLMDRAHGRLNINAVHAEPNAPMNDPRKTARAIADAIEELGKFLGTDEIVYNKRVPEGWKRALR